MTEHEIKSIIINTNDPANWKLAEHRMICQLFKSEYEQTYLEKLKPDQIFVDKSEQGIEFLIIKGHLFCGTEIYPGGSWFRLPINSAAKFQAGPSSVTLCQNWSSTTCHRCMGKMNNNVSSKWLPRV